ncbi:RrF2 family transcriptional regulator [Bradyrhizobium semiaridum]|uniref:RrF2 family transcriptional regulator n=1 Tax=Bradyrhizobium semiaridum TaxID=2821404 RepID=UPI001CE25381|nr:Rrf2 family transcriptional regulator [Bradyrhizobium semiaridum]
MRLTSFTDFALRALMRLAGEPGRSFATGEIAAEFGISRNHLAKVVRDLAEAGFIATQRGAGGGFVLARPPETVTLGEVVRTGGRQRAGRVLQGWWRRLRAAAALSAESKTRGGARGLHARARWNHAGGMRVPAAPFGAGIEMS